MVLVSSTSKPQACIEFDAEIYISMHHTNTPIRRGFETTVQIENIRQTVFIIEMDKVCSITFLVFHKRYFIL
jgi:GTPase